VQLYSGPVEAGRQEVVDGERLAGGVELLEDRADAPYGVGVGLGDRRQLHERHLEALEAHHGLAPGRPELLAVALVLFGVVLLEPVLEPLAPVVVVVLHQKPRAGQDPPLELDLRFVEARLLDLPVREVEHHLVVVVRVLGQEVQVEVKAPPL
jgi:hypothetical protein